MRRGPIIAATHHAAAIDIFLIDKVAKPCNRATIGGPISAHEALDQDVEFGLTLIAFGWRAHLTAHFGDGPTRADLAPLGLKKASARGALIQIKIQQMPARRFSPP